MTSEEGNQPERINVQHSTSNVEGNGKVERLPGIGPWLVASDSKEADFIIRPYEAKARSRIVLRT